MRVRAVFCTTCRLDASSSPQGYASRARGTLKLVVYAVVQDPMAIPVFLG